MIELFAGQVELSRNLLECFDGGHGEAAFELGDVVAGEFTSVCEGFLAPAFAFAKI
jgi:hypothetical protein